MVLSRSVSSGTKELNVGVVNPELLFEVQVRAVLASHPKEPHSGAFLRNQIFLIKESLGPNTPGRRFTDNRWRFSVCYWRLTIDQNGSYRLF